MQKLLFYRDFRRYSGGHGKVWDYFRHAAAAPGWQPVVHFAPGSVDEHNPWVEHRAARADQWRPEDAQALFLGGLDWAAYPADRAGLPVVNLVQGVRHGDPRDPRHRHLQRPAIRICVSEAIARAISVSNPNGPVLVIEAGIHLPPADVANADRHCVFIDALKQPALGQALKHSLEGLGRPVSLSTQRMPRSEYLRCLAGAAIAVTLPGEAEGFYLPGLEAMGLGCATVVPDCIGNRAYLQPEVNALSPALELSGLVAAVHRLLDDQLRGRLAEAGIRTATRFGLEREREAFLDVMANLDRLWAKTRPVTGAT